MLLSLLFIFFIGRAFYSLAEEHSNNKWLFAILGVASYYTGAFVFRSIVNIYLSVNYDLETIAVVKSYIYILTYEHIPVGLLASWISYRILKSTWKRKSPTVTEHEILDSNLINNKTDL